MSLSTTFKEGILFSRKEEEEEEEEEDANSRIINIETTRSPNCPFRNDLFRRQSDFFE